MKNDRPIIIGHRGHEFGPENSVDSFLKAVECGAEMLELDVWLTGDGVPIVYHDEFLSSGGAEPKRIAEYRAAAVEILQLPGGGRIPTLEGVLIEVLPKVPLNIELKFFDLNYRPLVRAVLALLHRYQALDRVLVSSFFHQSLEVVNWEEPGVATAPIFGVPTGPPHRQDLEKLAALGEQRGLSNFQRPTAVVDYLMLTEEVITEFKESDLALIAYTVDEPDEMRRVADLGVEGIITKKPAMLREVLH